MGEQVGQALLWSGDAPLHTHTSPSGPHRGHQSLSHHSPGAPVQPQRGQMTFSPAWGKGPGKPKGTKLKYEASTGLNPTFPWNLSQLNTAGTRWGSYTFLFCLSSSNSSQIRLGVAKLNGLSSRFMKCFMLRERCSQLLPKFFDFLKLPMKFFLVLTS